MDLKENKRYGILGIKKKILADKLNFQSIYKRPRPAQNLPTPITGLRPGG
jgi:hypothetical protein